MGRLRNSADQMWRKRLSGESGKILLAAAVGMTALILTGLSGGPSGGTGAESASEAENMHSFREDAEDVEIIKAVYRDIRGEAGDMSETVSESKSGNVSGTASESGMENVSESRPESVSETASESRSETVSESGPENISGTVSEDMPYNLETVRVIVERLGEKGYAAVDSGNQVDMACPERIRQFNGEVAAGEKAEETLIVVISDESFIKYDFAAHDGAVDVRSRCFQYGEDWETVYTRNYLAHTWVCSGEGYLFFEEYHKPGFDGPSGHTAVRVEPLPEDCRELNRKYLREMGYGLNNLFIADWSEDDFRELNFYDLYESLCQMKYGRSGEIFYEEGISYEIPASAFESVYQTFFRIDRQTLRRHTTWHEETGTYRYRARGMYDIAPTADIPYPEVVSWEENRDGTVKLTVNAVWPEENLEKAFCHEVVIRPLKNGGFQYISNRVIPSEKNVEVTWYAERLSDDEWRECYGEGGAEETKLPVQGSTEAVSVLTKQEKQRLQEEVVSAALCAAYCRETGIDARQADGAHLLDLSKEQRTGIVKYLGERGLVSVSDGVNMENHEKMEEFYAAYISGGEALVTVFEVHRDGELCAKTFIYREGSLQSYYVSAGFLEGEEPVIKGAGAKDLEEVRMTEKGYFIYTNAATVMHGNLREYYRVKPLSDRCRELTDRYVYGLSYVNYNMLVTDWDADNAEDILMPCMFEDIYRICTGEPFRAENGRIPAKTYERIMTTCFPVSADQLREHCGYRADTESYPYEMILGKQFPPFGEVVDYRENGDGTITLYVDGVWIDYDSDEAFVNTIVVKPFADGTFRYLSNTIEKRELEIPKVGE